MSKVMHDKEAYAYIDESINNITLPVASTFGPKGHSVLIQQNENSILTKDGLTVCKHLYPDNTNPIIKNIKNTLISMESKVGDGTTTTAILINALWSFFNKNRTTILKHYSPYTFCDISYNVLNNIISTIEELYTDLDISSLVATISNNDKSIIDLFQEHPTLNRKGFVHFCNEDSNSQIYYYPVRGEYFYNEMFTLEFPSIKEAHFHRVTKPIVLIQDKFNIEVLRSYTKEDNIVIITHSSLTELDIQNLKSNSDNYNVSVFYSPSLYRSKLITSLNMSAYDLISKDFVTNITADIKFGVFIETANSQELHHNIIVAEPNELSYEEKIHRIEDCIKAIGNSTKGVCEGAGLTYYDIASSLKEELNNNINSNPNYIDYVTEMFIHALNAPNYIIQGTTRLNNEELKKLKIKDSTKVLTTALYYAFEAVKPLILTNYIILNTY